MHKTYAYIRVSTREQNEDRQLIAMQEMGVPRRCTYIDKQSGKDFVRPAYIAMVKRLKPGDLLFVKSIDRLGRNYSDIQEQWRFLIHEKGINICVLDMPLLDTRTARDLIGTFVADLTLQILSFVAQTERESIRQRQREGIEAAKRRGVVFGRPLKQPSEYELYWINRWQSGAITAQEALKHIKISRATLYRVAKRISK
ncbi:MAG: recombinase family protein [Clostridia bacterium]|nr:recombinase family protein [Clostridia bacterium]